MTAPISCDLHDHLEVACLYRYRLLIELTDRTQIIAQARTTLTDSDKTEYLILEESGQVQRIPMHLIAWIEPLTEGARFGRVNFTNRAR